MRSSRQATGGRFAGPLLLAALLLGSAAGAEEIRLSPTETAKMAIRLGHFEAAEEVLLAQPTKDTETLFLLGQIEGKLGRPARAEEYYRQILADKPDLPRVRLELAKSLFDRGSDIAAAYQFRLAIAGDVPVQVRNSVMAYLGEIKRRRVFGLDVDFGLLPDSNVNKSPNVDQVQLFGLPFTLSDSARQKSGVGISASTTAEYAQPLDDQSRVRAGFQFYRNEYPGGQFDDMQVKPYVGPQWLTGWGDVSALAFGVRRWYGNSEYTWGGGGRLELGWNATDNYRLDVGAEAAKLWYPDRHFLDGYSANLMTYHTYYLDPVSYVRGIVGVGHDEAAVKAFQDNWYQAGIAYHRELPWGITGEVQPDITVFDYKGLNFGQRRRDYLVRGRLTVTKRDWDLFGFAPQVTFVYENDVSTVKLFEFDRYRFQIGLTRTF